MVYPIWQIMEKTMDFNEWFIFLLVKSTEKEMDKNLMRKIVDMLTVLHYVLATHLLKERQRLCVWLTGLSTACR